jgi:hypothetical protein
MEHEKLEPKGDGLGYRLFSALVDGGYALTHGAEQNAKAQAEAKAAKRAAKLAAKHERLAAKHGLTVEEIRAGRAVEATRKRRCFGVGIGI